MKKIWIITVLALSLCLYGCAQQPAQSGESGITADSIGEEISSAESGDISADKADIEVLTDAMKTKNADDFFGNDIYDKLSKEGLTVAVKNTAVIGTDTVTFDVAVTDKETGKGFAIENMHAKLKYYGIDSVVLNSRNLWVENAFISVADGIVIAGGFDEIRFFDTETMQEMPLDVFVDTDMEIRWHNTVKVGDKYVFSCHAGDDFALVVADKGGNTTLLPANLTDYYREYDSFSGELSLRGNDPDRIYIGGSYCYDINQGVLYLLRNRLECYEDSQLFRFEKWVSASENGTDHHRLTVEKDGKVVDVREFYGLEINEVFGTNQQTNEFGSNVEFSFAHDYRDVIIHCPDTQATVFLDRETATGTVVYQPDDRQVKPYFSPIYSNDRRYTICDGASAGGGDYWVSQKILHDSQTGKYSYIGVIGGMYGGGESIGFFSNDDIYMFGHTEFLVFEKGMAQAQPKFVMSKNFPLGKVDEGNIETRYIYAVRRDPKTFEYIVVYADFPHCSHVSQLETEPDSGLLKPTYTIGFLNSDGKLKNIIKTDAHVEWGYFGFNDVYMYLDGNQLHFMPCFKSQYYTTEVIADVDTEEVTVLRYDTEQTRY